MNSTLLTLPSDCLISIVNFVDRSNIFNLERSCKGLKDASHNRTALSSSKPISFNELSRYPRLLAYDGYVNIDSRGKLSDSLAKRLIRTKSDAWWLADFMKNHPVTSINAEVTWLHAPATVTIRQNSIRIDTEMGFHSGFVELLHKYRPEAVFSISTTFPRDALDFEIASCLKHIQIDVYTPIESNYIIQLAAKEAVKTLLICYKGPWTDMNVLRQLKIPKDLQITWAFPVVPKQANFD